MITQNKVLIVAVTYNNQALLQNFITSFEKQDPGFDYDLLIADNSSTEPKHLSYLNKLAKKYTIREFENDRVEVTFNSAYQPYIDEYKYFLFLHDDTVIMQDDWLRLYIERLQSNYYEPEIKQTHYANYPIGRCSLAHQPWRDYESCLGYPLNSLFLKDVLKVYGLNTLIYKYSDIDRTMYTQECLKKCGLWSVKRFKDMGYTDEMYIKLCKALNDNLQYPDEGMTPKIKYPPGKCWNKFVLLSEFFNSVMPLMEGFRTVGLQGNGFLEQIHGFDEPWSNNIVTHLGMPNVKKFFAKQFKCTPEEIHKKLYQGNNLPFLLQCNTILKEYFKNA